MKNIFNIFTIILLFVTISCQEGLAPEGEADIPLKSFIKGKIYYKGGIKNFPDSSEVFGIYAAAFKKYPSDSAGILGEFEKRNVFFNPVSLPYPADSSEFSLEITELPQNLEYIIVAMQTTSSLFSQSVIGVYTISGDNTLPSEVYVEKGEIYDIKINVDFDNLPPQPF